MGQYYLPVNLDKRQYLDPHKFDDGLKLLEFGLSSCGTMLGLAVLLADGNNRGCGDLHSDDPIIGSWAGDRIVIAGDYADPGKFMEADESDLQAIADKHFSEGFQQVERVNLYCVARERFEDVSEKVIAALTSDDYIKARFERTLGETYKSSPFTQAMERVRGLRPDLVITAGA